jgi:hypothetical protein
LHQL